MSRLLYFLLLKPLSLLPFRFLYGISDLMYLLIYYLAGYRKKVVFSNLKRSFPEKSEAEIQKIAQQFYVHFCDLMVEILKMLSLSEKELQRRAKWKNPQCFERYFAQNRHMVFGCGHYANWEMGAVGFSGLSPYKIFGVYQPLSNRFLNKKIKISRERFGVCLVSREVFKETVRRHTQEDEAEAISLGFGTDQNPTSRSNKLFWTRFLNQDTAVNFGLEKYAVECDAVVFFMKIKKIKRGYYEYEFEHITDTPKLMPRGKITRRHTRMLEQQIEEMPQYWLWTHKRWKRKLKPPQQ